MLTKIKKAFLIVIILLANVLTTAIMPALPAMAKDPAPGNGCTSTQSNTLTFFPAWYDGLLCSNGNIKSPGDSSLGKDSGARFGTWLTIIAMNIVRMLLFVVGYTSLIFIIWGGFKYMTQGDNSSGTSAARKTIQNALIGLIISIMSVSIVTFVAGKISSSGGGDCTTTAGTTSQTQNASTKTTTKINISQNDLNLSGSPCKVDSSTVGNLLNIAYLIAGIVAILAIIVGGIRYATASGESAQITAAKDTIFYAVVGLVVIIAAAAITQFVITQITK